MKNLIMVTLVLLPGMSFAQSIVCDGGLLEIGSYTGGSSYWQFRGHSFDHFVGKGAIPYMGTHGRQGRIEISSSGRGELPTYARFKMSSSTGIESYSELAFVKDSYSNGYFVKAKTVVDSNAYGGEYYNEYYYHACELRR